MDSFTGRTVLITGASSGIGKVFAEKFAEHKANLILTARREENLKSLCADLAARHHIRADFLACDLAAPEGPKRLHDWVRAGNYKVDLLVNNAGFGGYGRFADEPLDTWLKMIQLNVHSLVELTHLFLPEIKKQRGGIIQIASTASFQAVPYLAVYAATKSFVRSFSEALWAENRDIRVFCLCPGNTESEFHAMARIHEKKVFLRATTEDLVEFGIKAFLKSRSPTKIHGTVNFILASLNRMVPSRTALWFTRKLYESQEKKHK